MIKDKETNGYLLIDKKSAVYLVGGAVRDRLLGLPVKDRDWVVVGCTPKAMIEAGFKPVGKDFPVFLHPQTGEEYALARTERKSGKGHQGFNFYYGNDVSLEDDLQRRDLTINALAIDQQDQLIDTVSGLDDIKQKQLKHISEAFREDPLRVLRVARFQAKLSPFGFSIAPQTWALMQEMTHSGELKTLSQERITQEMIKALDTPGAALFFQTLLKLGALEQIMRPLHEHLIEDKHAESTQSLKFAIEANATTDERFAAFTASMKSEAQLNSFFQTLRLPKTWQALARLGGELYRQLPALTKNTPEKYLALLEKLDAFRRTERFEKAIKISHWFFKARSLVEHQNTPEENDNQWNYQKSLSTLRQALTGAQSIDTKAIIATTQAAAGLSSKNPDIGQALRQARLAAITQAID